MGKAKEGGRICWAFVVLGRKVPHGMNVEGELL